MYHSVFKERQALYRDLQICERKLTVEEQNFAETEQVMIKLQDQTTSL